MTKRMKKVSGRVASTTAVTIALGLLLWAILAYAGAGVSLNKTQFGRGGDTVISTMTGGIASGSYTVEYYGPTANDGTDSVLKLTRTVTANTSGTATDSYATQVTDTSGSWMVRYLHNPNKTNAGRIVIDGPARGTVMATSTAYTFSFHVEDRNGNTVLTNHAADLACTLRSGTTRVQGWRGASPTSGNGWAFNTSTGQYTRSYTTGGTVRPRRVDLQQLVALDVTFAFEDPRDLHFQL